MSSRSANHSQHSMNTDVPSRNQELNEFTTHSSWCQQSSGSCLDMETDNTKEEGCLTNQEPLVVAFQLPANGSASVLSITLVTEIC